MIEDTRNKISDKELFESAAMRSHLSDIAAAAGKRYRRGSIRVTTMYEKNDEMNAATDNRNIVIYAGNEVVTVQPTREERYMTVIGLLAHETGHILYSDFPALEMYMTSMEVGRWYPVEPVPQTAQEINNLTDLNAALADETRRGAVIQLANFLDNCMEDGYIENELFEDYPGSFTYGLGLKRDTDYDLIKSIPTMIAAGQKDLEIFLQIFLSYAKYGLIKSDDYDGELLDRLQACVPIIDPALVSRNSMDRFTAANQVLLHTWDMYQEQEQQQNQQQNQSGQSGQQGLAATAGNGSGASQAQQQLKQQISNIAGQSKEAKGSTGSVKKPGKKGSGPASSTAKQSGATKKTIFKVVKADPSNGQQPGAGEQPGAGRQAENGQQPGAALQGGSNDADDDSSVSASGDTDEADGGDSEGGIIAASEEETGRILYHETDGIESGDDDSGTEFDRGYEGEEYPFAASEIETLLQKIAGDKVNSKQETERTHELNAEARGISYGNAHAGIGITVHRRAEVSETLVAQYLKVAPPLLAISKRLQKSIIQKLRDARTGGKQTGLLLGRRIDVRTAYRNDGKLFYKNKLPEDTPRLAVSVLIDQSGSMSSDYRSVNARAAAIVLYDFCNALNIPVEVYGHCCCRYGHVDLYSFAEFREIDRNDRYRLMDIDAHNACNRDGAALRFACDRLSKRDEEAKLMILISDGQPNDHGYNGSAAEADLRGVKKEYERKGVTLIAAAIGDDKEVIERIYGNSFLNISDLQRLPVELTKLVLKNLKI